MKERTRADWDYPPLPAFQLPGRTRKVEDEDGEERVAGFKFHPAQNHDRPSLGNELSLGLDFEPAEWREREYTSEESSEDESAETNSSHSSKRSEYKFDGPDSVGVQISDRKLARKRKRRKALDEEVAWNDGLAHWIAQRDIWSGAHTAHQVQLLESHTVPQPDSPSASAESTPRTSTSDSSASQSSIAPPSSPSTTPELAPEPAPVQMQPPAPSLEMLVPLAPPILPNHPVRRRITSDVYPEIYTKIIIHGRAPSVPINLLVLVQALVQGWKDDGEWPPKQGPLEKSIGRKKGAGHESTLKHGVRAVGRVLRITGGESTVGNQKERG